MWKIPKFNNEFKTLCANHNITSVHRIPVSPELFSIENRCHDNVIKYKRLIGGKSEVGAYVIKHVDLPVYQFIKHSVIILNDEKIDITPFNDTRLFNIFVNFIPKYYNTFIHSLDKYIFQESDIMYYVYVYINPETNKPMYVGKGSGNRAYSHLQENARIDNKRFRNKINSLRRKGIIPKIEFLAENICDEDIAYKLEESFIKKYGRKGYDKNGILLNICISASPPNNKGRTYKEMYGQNAERIIEERRQAQIKCGGYGPKKHSEKTKRLISKATSGKNNPRYGATITQKTRDSIGRANKGKRRNWASIYVFDYYNEQTEIKGTTDAIEFCKNKNISWSTLWKNNNKKMGRCKRGKTKGWKLTILKNKR